MPPLSKTNPSKPAPRPARTEPAPLPAPKTGIPQGATELGWLPDFVYTNGKFEAGLAFFADALGRITRFSREPADLAAARRLAGQAALPGLVNGHSTAWHRVLRGRTEQPARNGADPLSPWREAHNAALAKLSSEDVFEAARMAFTEMALSGITCVGEFLDLHFQLDGTDYPEPAEIGRQVLRAAHEVGIRVALFNVASLRSGYRQPLGSGNPRSTFATTEAYLKQTEALRKDVETRSAADEAWIGVAPDSLARVPLAAFKEIASYAHAQRLRLHTRAAARPDDNTGCADEFGRTALALLADHGIVDKRFTAIHGIHASDDEIKLLGSARATVCTCPTTEADFGLGLPPLAKLFAAGAGVAFGTGTETQVDLLKDARLIEYTLRSLERRRPAIGDAATTLFHAATVAGARSLGATGGALEPGRPADFFTVNIYEPSIAGADADSLLANILFSLERRAIREVWVGARQRIVNGRHPNQGLIVGRFVEQQQRLWRA